MALQHISDNIWLGSLLALKGKQTLKDSGVTHVLSVLDIGATGLDERKFCDEVLQADFKHLYLNVQDVEDENLMQYFEQTNAFIDEALSSNGGVLVHCIAGISRSASCVCAYLMKTRKWTPKEAIEFVRTKRPVANPNDGFVEQLNVYFKCGFKVNDDLKPYREWKLKQQARELDFQKLRSLPTTYTQVQMPPLTITWWHILHLLIGSKTDAASVTRLSIGDKVLAVTEPVAQNLGSGENVKIEVKGRTIEVPESKVRSVLDQVKRRVVVLRCKSCATKLATSASFVAHEPGKEGQCQHFFIEPMEWMRPELEKGELEGRIVCHNCSHKLGAYYWQGSKCSCGVWVTPAIKLQKSKVDDMSIQEKPSL